MPSSNEVPTMTHHWDEFSKALAEPVPRRESLRRLGVVLAGAVLSPLAAGTAWAGGKGKLARKGPPAGKDPGKAFCKCRNKAQQNACLAAFKACNGDTRRLCGTCGSYVCCGNGQTCCGQVCTDLASDFDNCGACGHACPQPRPYEYGTCIRGNCEYWCVEGAVVCGGACTSLDSDPDNCGACGNACGGSTPYCTQGECNPCVFPFVPCGGVCVDPSSDRNNCGACGIQCADNEVCFGGFCESGGGF
jgi:hypothetical protein